MAASPAATVPLPDAAGPSTVITNGEVTRRPTGSPSLRELTEYVYFRDNVAGVQREWWQHRTGCGEWFLAERDTRTNEVLEVILPDPKRPA